MNKANPRSFLKNDTSEQMLAEKVLPFGNKTSAECLQTPKWAEMISQA